LTVFGDISAHVKTENDAPQETAAINFSGMREIYDDGIFRIQLPEEFIPEKRENSLRFSINGLPFQIEWVTIVTDKSQIEQSGGSADTIEGVMQFLMCAQDDEEPARIVSLANGFYMASHACLHDGDHRAACLLAQFVDEDTLVAASMQLAAPEEWQHDSRLILVRHFLKLSVRGVYCSIGEPRMNTSEAWLDVTKIGIRFPEKLGGMIFCYARDYEFRQEGQGISLRYSDNEGRKADIFIFDNREELIEPGAETEQNLAQMQSAISNVKFYYSPATPEVVRKAVTSYGQEEIAFLDVRFVVPGDDLGGPDILTGILIAARLGAFIKVRFTSLPGETQPKHPRLEMFMHDLADVLHS
jgi:hypothetical protein